MEHYGLQLRKDIETFTEALAATKSGIAEVVIPPGSSLIGKSARDVWLRKTYGIAMVALHRGGETLREGDGIRDLPLQAGDTLVVHTTWEALARLEQNRNFVVVTTEFPHEELRPQKVCWAGLFFGIALFMVLFTDIRLSVALLTGAIGMILSGVLTIEEAYKAVSWKTVFLLATLIPLGLAVETTGTAKWIAEQTLAGGRRYAVVGDPGCRRGAGDLLHPGDVERRRHRAAGAAGGEHRHRRRCQPGGIRADGGHCHLELLPDSHPPGECPDHGPGRLPGADFMRAGGIMTVLFLVVSMLMLNLVF